MRVHQNKVKLNKKVKLGKMGFPNSQFEQANLRLNISEVAYLLFEFWLLTIWVCTPSFAVVQNVFSDRAISEASCPASLPTL